MDFSLFHQINNPQSRLMKIVFYGALALLAATVVFYLIFAFKIYLQNQKINELDQKILAYGDDKQRALEKKYVDYKKKINDVTALINNHKISSNVFSLIEQKTLPNVWFSSFNASLIQGEVNLIGETESMQTLSSQVRIFEESTDYIENVVVISSQASEKGRVTFSLNISLNPKIFTEDADTFSAGKKSESSSPLSAQDNLQSQPYTAVTGEFSIRYPKNWVLGQGFEAGVLATFLNEKIDQDGQNSFSANIQVSSGPAKSLSLDSYVKAQKNALPKVLSGYELIQERKVNVNGADGYIIDGSFSKGALQLRSKQLIVVKNSKAYLVTGTALNSTWDTYKDLMEASLLTFTLN